MAKKIEFRCTFGQQYGREPHPTLEGVTRDHWLSVMAVDRDAARELLDQKIGPQNWSMLYDPRDAGYPTRIYYPRGQFARLLGHGGIELKERKAPKQRHPRHFADGLD